MKNIFLLASLALTLGGCAGEAAKTSEEAKGLTQWVDPYIGSGGHGHVFVGANVPHGMVQLGTVNISEGWDWCSGYHISDTTVIGFAHTHLSGTGIGDKGDIQLLPVVGTPEMKGKKSFVSTFSRSNEEVEAGYYSVVLDRYKVKAELTATERVGYHRYSYPKGETPQMIVNLRQGIGWDWPTDVYLKKTGPKTIEGQRLSTGWAEDDRVFFVANFSSEITDIVVKNDTTYNPHNKTQTIVENAYYMLTFAPADTLSVELAISGVDIEGAKKNMVAEGGRGFDVVRAQATSKWDDYLGKVQAKGGSEDQKKTFYTALYHTGFFPGLWSDVDGRYRGTDGKIYTDNERMHYATFSLWDTYRALHPMMTITQSDMVVDLINSLLDISEQQGKPAVWNLTGNENNCMVGFSSVQVIADAILKDFKGFDYERAYNVIKGFADLDERGMKDVRELGFIRADKEGESVAKALEYAISDYAVAQVAKKLGKEDDYKKFLERSKYYQKYFDKNDNFVKGILSDGSFRTPFDPAHTTHRADDFCEGNSWQYSWMVPHDFEGLIGMFASPEAAEAKLDSLFTTPFVAPKEGSPDISGMIGQYAHGNEPSHSTIYAYHALGKPQKSAALARRIVDSLYHAAPDGLSGNEDCGQMSAWYALNAMGLYQANPSGGDFLIGSPIFQEVTINLPENKTFTIKAHGYSKDKTYHTRAELNGEPFTGTGIPHATILAGGTLELWAE